MANQNANYYDIIKKDGVTYYLKDQNTIVDIDVENWVQEVRFISSPHATYSSCYYGRPSFAGCKKTVPSGNIVAAGIKNQRH